jgi:drug/metabolite transporter (DMT)-like permease
MNKKLAGFSSLLAAGITFGSFGIWIRLLSQELTIYQQIVFRNAIAMIFAIGIIVIIGKGFSADFRKVKKSNLFLYGLTVPLAVIFYNIAILNIKIAVTTFAFFIGSILFSWIFSVVFFKEKITTLKVLSLISVVIGLIFSFGHCRSRH